MRRVYLMVFNSTFGSRDQVIDWANKSSAVLTWRADMSHSIYLVSEGSADDIKQTIPENMGVGGAYLISEVTDNRNGKLVKDSWYFLNNKRVKPKE
jgi:hypothetical protein